MRRPRELFEPQLHYQAVDYTGARTMTFEINLQGRIDAYVLRCAGLDVEAYIKQSMDAVIGKQVVPFELQLPYFDGDLWVEIFLDDIDSPDLAIYGDAETIRRFRSSISND
jgi:hypothetical protein